MSVILFIGGVADGRRMDIPTPFPRIYSVPDPGIFDFVDPEVSVAMTVAKYRLETLACNTHLNQENIFFLYVEDSFSAREMLSTLIDGYGRS
jgi:hypothetical protein